MASPFPASRESVLQGPSERLQAVGVRSVNLNAGVDKPDREESRLNPSFCEFARHYKVAALPRRWGRATNKGLVEACVGTVESCILLEMHQESFFTLEAMNAALRRDLLEIAEARHGRKSILIAGQILVERWPEVIGKFTIAHAVLDQIVHNAYRIDLKGESQRKRNKPSPFDGGNDE